MGIWQWCSDPGAVLTFKVKRSQPFMQGGRRHSDKQVQMVVDIWQEQLLNVKIHLVCPWRTLGIPIDWCISLPPYYHPIPTHLPIQFRPTQYDVILLISAESAYIYHDSFHGWYWTHSHHPSSICLGRIHSGGHIDDTDKPIPDI